ncbi:MAG: PEGA domain-containing protein [Candidatus Omnitrophota bacterium]|nr:PEGA domain-containing protein [Candidatus Omnitrophota bacterium]MDD5517947.1 PEGA domain-containing protein [Candidatus Omnitrophota bacterium]
MSNEQRIRAVLFYLSVAVFFIGLPAILSSSLGYKFNPRTLKFTKAGIISLKTQPQGASIYLDGKLLNDKTPATINELLPGSYNLKLELKAHYPWFFQVNVEPRKVVRLEKIILFPTRSNIEQLNQDKVSRFWLDKDNARIYYLNQEGSILYESDFKGEKFKEIGNIPSGFIPFPKELKVSPDKEKMLIFNAHQIAVLYPGPAGDLSYAQPPVLLDFPGQQINNVFWHSDSYHLVLVTDRSIKVTEMQAKSSPVNLVNLNSRISEVSYEANSDTLYFMDSQTGEDGVSYDNIYKLELNKKVVLFNDLMRLRQNAKE